VVILPGLGNAAEDYDALARSIEQRLPGAVVRTAPVARQDWLRNAAGVVTPEYWLGTLNPRPTVDWYLERISTAVAEARLASQQERVTLLAHSAGGWLARVWLAQHGASSASCLLTLGSPLRAPPVGVAGVFDQTRGILTHVAANSPSVADLAQEGCRTVCVAGRFVRGAAALAPSTAGEWVVGQGYRQVCGEAEVWGDGITPCDWALLPGAEHVVLDGVYHSPLGAGEGRKWYGSEGVIEQWLDRLVEGSAEGSAAVEELVATE
jgi:pimeloyl-ACP methyl ester carboxylesterase